MPTIPPGHAEFLYNGRKGILYGVVENFSGQARLDLFDYLTHPFQRSIISTGNSIEDCEFTK
jgi:hypothetical protein